MNDKVKEQIAWVKKEAQRNSRMQGEKRDDGTRLHSCNRRRTLRGRAHQLNSIADTLQSQADEIERLEAALRAIAKNCCKQPECYAADIAIAALDSGDK